MFGEYLPGLEKTPLPTVVLFHRRILPGRSLWALLTPKHHDYYFAFADKSVGAQSDELKTLVRKILRSQGVASEGERLAIDNLPDDS